MTLYSLLTGANMIEIEKIFEGKGYGDFKVALAAEVTAFLSPLQKKIKSYLEDEDMLKQVLASGAEKAREIAQKKMIEVRKKIGVA
jgi:tryptophanyl-tRNA synthetase